MCTCDELKQFDTSCIQASDRCGLYKKRGLPLFSVQQLPSLSACRKDAQIRRRSVCIFLLNPKCRAQKHSAHAGNGISLGACRNRDLLNPAAILQRFIKSSPGAAASVRKLVKILSLHPVQAGKKRRFKAFCILMLSGFQRFFEYSHSLVRDKERDIFSPFQHLP